MIDNPPDLQRLLTYNTEELYQYLQHIQTVVNNLYTRIEQLEQSNGS